MNPTSSINSPAPDWPEPLRDSPKPADRFPLGLFLLWFLPGLIGLIALAGIFFFLEQRAAKQILYRTTDGQIGAVRADGTGARELTLLSEDTRFIGSPQWAQRESRFASVISDTTGLKLLIADLRNSSPISISLSGLSFAALNGDAWAPGSGYVAIVGRGVRDDGFSVRQIQLVDVAGKRVITSPLTLDTLSMPQWHPQRDALLLTAINAEGIPELQVLTPDGQSQPFAPPDNQLGRQDGAWSPDGGRVAYTATAAITSTTRPLLVANTDGGSPQVVVPDGINFQPRWAPRGDLIVFTRLVTVTDELCRPSCIQYILYRVQPDGQNLQPIGRGLPPELVVGASPQVAVDWSPDQESMYFQSYDEQAEEISLQIARYDGSEPNTVVTEARSSQIAQTILNVHWSPTSRAVLIASPSGGLRLRWFDRDTPEEFAQGVSAAWEP